MTSKQPLVILYSTACRLWDKTIDNQMELINKLTDTPIFGIHYWKEIIFKRITDYPNGGISIGQEQTGIAPDFPPEQIQAHIYKHSITSQSNEFRQGIIKYAQCTDYGALVFLYIIISTKEALENAEKAYKEKFGIEIPDDQIILRLRPDIIVKGIESYVEYIEYMQQHINKDLLWCTTERPNTSLQTDDCLCITTKKIMKKLTDIDLRMIEPICNKYRQTGRRVHSPEEYLYTLLEEIGAVKINFTKDMKVYFKLENDGFIER
jgi:hypothetical protein